MSKGRQIEIRRLVRDSGYLSVKTLASTFGVDSSTIRRDLDRLQRRGDIERSHGGASAPQVEDPRKDIAFSIKERQHQAEKTAIGAAMAERIGAGQTVLLDSGSTTLEVARHLRDHERLTLITNDLRIGVEVASHPNSHVVVLGGELLPNVYTLWGSNAVNQLKNLNVDVAVFGADAVNADAITNTNGYEIELKQAMHEAAGSSFLVADSSKFERQALTKVLNLSDFTAGITDDRLEPILSARYPIPIIRVPVRRAEA